MELTRRSDNRTKKGTLNWKRNECFKGNQIYLYLWNNWLQRKALILNQIFSQPISKFGPHWCLHSFSFPIADHFAFCEIQTTLVNESNLIYRGTKLVCNELQKKNKSYWNTGISFSRTIMAKNANIFRSLWCHTYKCSKNSSEMLTSTLFKWSTDYIDLCETQMPPIMANSKDGQGHKKKYLDTSRKNAHVQYESSNIYNL